MSTRPSRRPDHHRADVERAARRLRLLSQQPAGVLLGHRRSGLAGWVHYLDGRRAINDHEPVDTTGGDRRQSLLRLVDTSRRADSDGVHFTQAGSRPHPLGDQYVSAEPGQGICSRRYRQQRWDHGGAGVPHGAGVVRRLPPRRRPRQRQAASRTTFFGGES
jgi:hypothetical protein